MKIAIVGNSSWDIHNSRMRLIRALQAKGHELLVIAPFDDYSKHIEAAGVKFIHLKHLRRGSTQLWRESNLLLTFFKIYRKEKIDLALQYTIKPNIYGSLVCGVLRTRSICNLTGLGHTFLSKGFINWLSKFLYRSALVYTSKVFFENQDDLNLFLRLRLLAPKKAVIMKGAGVDTQFFKPLAGKVKSGKDFCFLFVGRLLETKGIKDLFQAFVRSQELNPNLRLKIIGAIDNENPSGISKKELEDFLLDHPSVEYLAHTDDIRTHIDAADCVVLPSHREGLPRILMEGMAMEKPLIATDVPGCRELIEDQKNGFLVPLLDTKALSKAMLRIEAMSPAERLTMGAHGRRMAIESFDEQIVITDYLHWVKQLENV